MAAPFWMWLIGALALVNTALLLWLMLRHPGGSGGIGDQIRSSSERLELALRNDISASSRGQRQELAQNLATFQQALLQQSGQSMQTQSLQMEAFAQQLAHLQKSLSDTLTLQLGNVSESNARRMVEMSESNALRMSEIRQALETQLAQLQATNTAKLEEMRATVDEKLQATLQARLGESFKQVAERLEQVHKGLGEMQTLAQGVGDLKHLLTNVKTRGMFGEAQLAGLLEQVFVPDQYAAQIATRPGSKNVVDFAIKLPGRSDSGEPLWLPIDAKFPNDDY